MGVKVRDNMDMVRTIPYTHSGATVKDTVYLLNGRVMLALNSKDANVENTFMIAGVIEYAKLSAQAWTAGDEVFWDNGNSRFTTVSSGNTFAGFAADGAANPSSTGCVLLMPAQPIKAANLEYYIETLSFDGDGANSIGADYSGAVSAIIIGMYFASFTGSNFGSNLPVALTKTSHLLTGSLPEALASGETLTAKVVLIGV